ncbi:MAG: gamma-glutamylcyclotransferase [Euryarchaeota archaeon]|nr:gamma-glutamylcyclotransferase [Euryarchaeota archaeon]MCD6158286.1 gamma-glutamylcyclotransferase [Euryarchaeota archaeon]
MPGIKIVVYGTLRRSCELHSYYLRNARFLGEDWIEGFELYVDSLPRAVKGKGRIKVEVFEVDEATFKVINEMEISANYRIIKVNTKYGEAYMWFWPWSAPGVKIESGDYMDYLKKSMKNES